ncbi:site-specific integrase [Pseudomonas viridiflava]|uniref:site-specific integrase n=1 Tax=Pseudomonas syringae group TaxID=136849 RepID=UPI0018E5D53B|nr:site-specific integrase [Pseudomonas viridiflava]MBI6576193.1 site-specific integrase [Pseudomonas viridiflava]MBI6608282.1 site-specific integrase [Pseudomonas viridiflava]MBI6637862.1 site-specific integrase [Pseudomonas viridiflava]MBI6869110.1 site-specific integrase [Pseudomonas viridiflava]
MDKAQRYLTAGTRENTRKSYRAAIEHFEVTWGGFLPATAEGIVRYLAEYADSLALSTLRQRLAAIAQWHVSQGFPDPTKAPHVRQMLKGIRVVHPAKQKQAAPLQLRHLEKAVNWLNSKADKAIESGDYRSLMRYRRDAALLLIGFWRGFRSDELARLQIEDTQAEAGIGITFYLPYTKADRTHQGTTFHTPALKMLCPVDSYINWITVAGTSKGPVFRKLDRWGNLSEKGLKASSLIPLLRRILEEAGIPAQTYSSHSMRRGFATWASANGWDIKGLMSYVGWKDMKSALRYIDASNSFGGLATNSSSEAALEAPRD